MNIKERKGILIILFLALVAICVVGAFYFPVAPEKQILSKEQLKKQLDSYTKSCDSLFAYRDSVVRKQREFKMKEYKIYGRKLDSLRLVENSLLRKLGLPYE